MAQVFESTGKVSVARPAASRARNGFYERRGKRLLDLALSLPLLVAATPLVIVLAVLVVLTSGWPPFYAAGRLGRSARPFRMWKLRTMVRDAEQQLEGLRRSDAAFRAAFARSFKLGGDPRVTRLGRWLRRSSLDELPQLLNVVRGEMSLVGPRPIVADELARYGQDAPVFTGVAPGMTGAWQVGGRNAIAYPERKAVEIGYCAAPSLATDLSILLKTVVTLSRFDGL